MPCLRPSAGCESLQPAAELGHLQRHEHALHDWRALLPAPQSTVARSPRHAPCTPRSPAASRLPARGSPRTACPACDPSAVRAGLQPATELGHRHGHGHARHVLRALLPGRTACTPIAPVHPREAARASPLIPRPPSLRLRRPSPSAAKSSLPRAVMVVVFNCFLLTEVATIPNNTLLRYTTGCTRCRCIKQD